MSHSLIVALSVVFPMAAYMLIGVACRRGGIIDRSTMKRFDVLAFKLFLSVSLFKNIYSADYSGGFSLKLVLAACLGASLLYVFSRYFIGRCEKDANKAASLSVSLFRSNYSLFGLAVAQSLFGEDNAGAVSLLAAIIVPLTSVYSVIVFEENRSKKTNLLKTTAAVLKNPLIIASLLAILLKLIHFEIPELLFGVIKSIASAATPLCFISLGVGLNLEEMHANSRILTISVLLKMVLIPAVMVTLSVLLGFRGQELCALMIAFAAPTAVNVYPMAISMEADGPTAAQMVALTTIVSIFSIFLITFILTSLNYF